MHCCHATVCISFITRCRLYSASFRIEPTQRRAHKWPRLLQRLLLILLLPLQLPPPLLFPLPLSLAACPCRTLLLPLRLQRLPVAKVAGMRTHGRRRSLLAVACDTSAAFSCTTISPCAAGSGLSLPPLRRKHSRRPPLRLHRCPPRLCLERLQRWRPHLRRLRLSPRHLSVSKHSNACHCCSRSFCASLIRCLTHPRLP